MPAFERSLVYYSPLTFASLFYSIPPHPFTYPPRSCREGGGGVGERGRGREEEGRERRRGGGNEKEKERRGEDVREGGNEG